MAQCKKILENGERCSNRAVPGTEYCEEHRRIQFRRVPKVPTVPAPPPEPRPGKKKEKPPEPPPPPEWVAKAGIAGEKPAFPGLRVGARGIMVAPEGLIWLGEKGAEDQPESLFERLVRLLGFLSQEVPLSEYVSVRTLKGGAGTLISLVPPNPERVDLPRLYDAAASAADLGGGLLYVGEGRAFIQYRDGGAPRGYDAAGVKPPPGDDIYLVDREGTHPLSPRALVVAPLDDLLLRIAPQPARGFEPPDVVFALVAPPLYRMLAKYFRAHHLRYRVSRFHSPRDETFTIFEVEPRPDAPTGTLVPGFVLSYLEGLPRCVVLTEVWAEKGTRMLVEWRRQYPCMPRHVVGAFPPDSLLLLVGGPDFYNMCVSPAPAFFEGDDLTLAHAPTPGRAGLKPLTDRETLPLELPVKLVDDPGPTPSTAALILDAREMGWVRRLLYRLPGEAFAYYSICVGEDRAVLLGEGMPVESIPFGIPLRRVGGTQLFIPLRARFMPDLPWSLLSDSLELKDDIYTFLARDFRIDVPFGSFAPISRALVAEPGRPRVKLEVHPAPGLPALGWSEPEPEPEMPQPGQGAEDEGGGILGRLGLGRRTEPVPRPVPIPRPVTGQQDIKSLFLKLAESHRREGDYLGAALLFAMAGDKVNAGRCYHEAAHAGRNDK